MTPERTRDAPAGDETIESALRDIWEEVLQYSPAGLEDDFFGAGGDSLLVAAFCTEVERRLGRRLPFPAVYETPTLTGLANLLAEAEARQLSPLVALNKASGGPPLFALPGVGGSVMDFAGVAPLIAGDRAVIGVQARGIDGSEEPLDRIEAMAEYSLASTRLLAPHGPYLFVGYSVGGLVAMEAARRALAAGEQVRLLALIDTYPHSGYWPAVARAGVRGRRAMHLAGALGHALAHAPWAEVAFYVGARLGLASRGRTRATPRSEWNPYDPTTTPGAVRRVHEAGLAALRAYAPRRYPGPVSFIRAGTRSFYVPDNPIRQWRDLALSLSVHTVRGDHIGILSRHAPCLAACLSSLIDEACPEQAAPLALPGGAVARLESADVAA